MNKHNEGYLYGSSALTKNKQHVCAIDFIRDYLKWMIPFLVILMTVII